MTVQLYFLILLAAAVMFGLGFRAGVRFCFDRRAKKILRGAWFKSMIRACQEGDREAKHRDHMNEAARQVMKTARCPNCDLFYPLDMEQQHHNIDCPQRDVRAQWTGKPWPAHRYPPGPIPPPPPAPAPPRAP